MSFYRFNVLNTDDTHQNDGIDYAILLNTEHIAAIKPINIMFKGNIINGFWVRLINGKKYRATRIPQFLKDLLVADDSLTMISVNDQDTTETPMSELELH